MNWSIQIPPKFEPKSAQIHVISQNACTCTLCRPYIVWRISYKRSKTIQCCFYILTDMWRIFLEYIITTWYCFYILTDMWRIFLESIITTRYCFYILTDIWRIFLESIITTRYCFYILTDMWSVFLDILESIITTQYCFYILMDMWRIIQRQWQVRNDVFTYWRISDVSFQRRIGKRVLLFSHTDGLLCT